MVKPPLGYTFKVKFNSLDVIYEWDNTVKIIENYIEPAKPSPSKEYEAASCKRIARSPKARETPQT